jgi:hypothetical protein
MHDDDLSPFEREALSELPREAALPRGLEERTVRALRARGLLHAPAPLRIAFTPAWIGAAAAAAFALFVGGFAIGQWAESRHTTELLVAMHERDAARAAAEVQRAGSAYVNALSSLAAVAASADPKNTLAVQQGREVAVNALTAAADQMVRLAPNDPLSARILQAMDEQARRDTTSAQSRLAWF